MVLLHTTLAKETEKSASTSIKKYKMMSLKELEINLIYDFLEVFT
ncbi:hypothetical protein SPAR49_0021 [Streptococcus pneumoniae GA17328]|nr:hypothetical protein SPAR49_0021 [Streptococcus pneumoniae GA17328]